MNERGRRVMLRSDWQGPGTVRGREEQGKEQTDGRIDWLVGWSPA